VVGRMSIDTAAILICAAVFVVMLLAAWRWPR
jgi:hypothetical protein